MAGSNQEWGLTEYFMARAFAPEAPGVYSSVVAPPQALPREDSKPSFKRTFSTPFGNTPSHWVVGASVSIGIVGVLVGGKVSAGVGIGVVGVSVGGKVGA